MMLSPADAATIEALHRHVHTFERAGKSAADFWDTFASIEGDLGTRAFSDDAKPELRERYCEVLANADDAGYAVPDEVMGEPFPE